MTWDECRPDAIVRWLGTGRSWRGLGTAALRPGEIGRVYSRVGPEHELAIHLQPDPRADGGSHWVAPEDLAPATEEDWLYQRSLDELTA